MLLTPCILAIQWLAMYHLKVPTNRGVDNHDQSRVQERGVTLLYSTHNHQHGSSQSSIAKRLKE